MHSLTVPGLAIAAFLAILSLTANSLRAQEAVTPTNVANVAEQVAEVATQTAEAAPPVVKQDTAPADERRFSFNFDHQPWKGVLERFSREAGLSLTMESPPPGTFNFSDTNRRYTVTEALDVLNRVLYTTKGYLLVRHGNMLVLVDTDANEVAPSLIPDLSLDELDKHGEYELVRVIFPIWNMTADQAGEQVRQLLGPKMKVVTLPQSRQIQVTELVGKLQMIRKVIESGNQPGPGGFRPFELKYISADAAMPVLRQSLGIPRGADVTPDGNPPNTPPSIRLTRSAVGNTLLFQGSPEGAARLDALLRLIDVPNSGLEMARQTEIYQLGTIDPKKALDVLEEMYRGNPNVSFVEDTGAGTLTAVAPPSAQAGIRATLESMQKDARQITIFHLTRLDPVSAKSIISNMFGGAGPADAPNPSGVAVDYDAAQRVLIVRGNKSQISQVREVLNQLGENSQSETTNVATRDKIRVLPYSQTAAINALRQITRVMPEMGDRIKIVSPPKGIPVRRPMGGMDQMQLGPQNEMPPQRGRGGEPTPGVFQRQEGRGTPPAVKPTSTTPDRQTRNEAIDNSRELTATVVGLATGAIQASSPAQMPRVRFVAQETTDPEAPPQDKTESAAAPAATPPAAAQGTQTSPQATAPAKKPVLVVPGPTGLVVVSEDLGALDELEQLLTLVAPTTTSTEREFAVYYLQFATAETAASVLSSLYGGTGGAGARGGGGRGGRGGGNIMEQITGQLVQQLAGSATDAIGGLLSSATGFSSAAVDIVPIIDKNAVLVRAKPTDLDMIEQIIEVIDQKSSPIEDESDPDPRRIQVYNVAAADMAAMIQAIYADRISSPGMGNQDFARLLTGGGTPEQQPQKMTIYADGRNNQLIVRAPAALFEKVANMVADLDQVGFDTPEITKVVPISASSMASIKGALDPIAAATQTTNNNNQQNNNQNQQLNQLQQLQQFNQLLGNRGRGGGGGNQGGARGGGGAGGLGNLQGLIGGGGGGGRGAGGGGGGGARGGGGGARGGGGGGRGGGRGG